MAQQPEVRARDLDGLVRRSWARAGPGLRAAWPPERRLKAGELLEFTAGCRFCTLAYLGGGERVHAIPVSFHMDGHGDFWIPAGPDAVRTGHLRSHPWAALVVGPEPGPQRRFVRAEGPGVIVPAAELPRPVADEAQHKLGDLSWGTSWLRILPESLLGWGAPADSRHSVGRRSRSPG